MQVVLLQTPSVVSGNAKGYESLNGNIVFISDGLEYRVECSNNNVILKETNWFKENRVWQQAKTYCANIKK